MDILIIAFLLLLVCSIALALLAWAQRIKARNKWLEDVFRKNLRRGNYRRAHYG